jgi:hypothetical protein
MHIDPLIALRLLPAEYQAGSSNCEKQSRETFASVVPAQESARLGAATIAKRPEVLIDFVRFAVHMSPCRFDAAKSALAA